MGERNASDPPGARCHRAVQPGRNKKGLSAEDYDGPRWEARLAKLKPLTPQPDEQDAVRFDVALTVSLMRYISDLYIGKVNPQRFHFQIDVTQRKYDLPEFLQGHVVNSRGRSFHRCARGPWPNGP
jgi:Scaffold domain